MSENNNRNTQQKPAGGPIGGPMGVGGRQTAGSQRSGGPMGFGGGIQIHGEKARDFKGTMRKFLKYISEFKIQVLIVIIFAIVSTVFVIIGPKLIGRATTKLFEGVLGQISGTGTGIDFKYIGTIIILAIGLYMLSALFSYIQGWLMTDVSMKITYRLRRDISEKINRLPLKYFDRTSQGEVLSRVTNDVDAINQTLNQSLTQIITSVTSVLGVLIMMFTISWIMTLVSLIIVPLSFMVIMAVVKRSQKFFRQQQDYLGHVNGHVEEIYGGHNVMKAFNGEKKSEEKFSRYNNILYGAAWKSQFFIRDDDAHNVFYRQSWICSSNCTWRLAGNPGQDAGRGYSGFHSLRPFI